MLVDDNRDDNFYHERVIRKSDLANIVISKESGMEALTYLKEPKDNKIAHPDLIFLDINMPGMDGWEFLEEYNNLEKEQQTYIVIVMLTTSQNPDDQAKAKTKNIASDFKTKPLTREMLTEIIDKYF